MIAGFNCHISVKLILELLGILLRNIVCVTATHGIGSVSTLLVWALINVAHAVVRVAHHSLLGTVASVGRLVVITNTCCLLSKEHHFSRVVHVRVKRRIETRLRLRVQWLLSHCPRLIIHWDIGE